MEKVITDSRFFQDHFNTAIFDDPLRLYFNRCDEKPALEIFQKLKVGLINNESYKKMIEKSGLLYVLLQPVLKEDPSARMSPLAVEMDPMDSHLIFYGTGDWGQASGDALLAEIVKHLPQLH